MARAELDIQIQDGGLGVTGPGTGTVFAAIGVASGADPIATQKPVVVSSAGDVETLLGIGPLRDLCVHALDRAGCTILAFPLERDSGGTPIDTAALTDGALEVTPDATGYALHMQYVVLECVTGGALGTCAFRLIVDGRPQPAFTPDAGDYANPIVIPAASIGSLATGVPAASTLAVEIAFAGSATAMVVGDKVAIRMSEPKTTAAALSSAIDKLVSASLDWEGVAVAGVTVAATHATLDTKIRGLLDSWKFLWCAVQAAGPELRHGATTAATSTAAYVSARALVASPARQDDPRLSIMDSWVRLDDPITGQKDKEIPGLYPALGHMAALESHQPPDATEWGPIERVKAIVPEDITGPQTDTLDNAWHATLTAYPGYRGVYITHWRMWGQFPESGVPGSDFVGIERRRLMDEASREVREALFIHLNGLVPTLPTGRMSPATQDQWSAEATSGLNRMVARQKLIAADAKVRDKDPGILISETVLVDISLVPHGKAAKIQATLAFRVLAASEEAA